MRKNHLVSATAFILCLFLASATFAQSMAEVSIGATDAVWQTSGNYNGYVLTISGPDNLQFHGEFGRGERPSFSVFDVDGNYLPDGSYNWELRVEGNLPAETANIDRDAYFAKGETLTGHLRIIGGAFVTDLAAEEASSAATVEDGPVLKTDGDIATKAQVFTTDLIVQGSACIGIDCSTSESFGFDTLRLKENNLRLHFDDTSSSGSFPNNDWRLTANDSSNGGANRFTIEDATAGKNVFTIEAGAPANSAYIDDGGRLGLGTTNPVVDIHAVNGNTPTLRLEQDGSSGFTAQTWDLAGNETNFFVRDVTNGSKLPFKIKPGAADNSLFIDENGDVGIGTTNNGPDADFHVRRTDAATLTALLENTNSTAQSTRMQFSNSANTWNMGVGADGRYQISLAGSGSNEILVNQHSDGSGDPTLDVDGSVRATNVTFSSSRDYKTGFKALDQQEILAKVLELEMTEWRFKKDRSSTRHIGPIAEDFHAAFQLNDDPKGISTIDIGGVAITAIQGLNQKVEQLEAEKAELRGELDELRAMIAALGQAQK